MVTCHGGSSKSILLLFSHSVVYNSFVILWTAARQAPLSMGFPRQKYWSGLPLPSPGDLPDPGIGPVSPALAGRFFTAAPPGKPQQTNTGTKIPQFGNTCCVILIMGSLVKSSCCCHHHGPHQPRTLWVLGIVTKGSTHISRVPTMRVSPLVFR